MKRSDRFQSILAGLAEQGELRVDDLVEELDASPATVRRDLDTLASQGLLTRTHGGAQALSVAYDLPLRYKRLQRVDAKQLIAETASALVGVGDVVGFSGGTTTTRIVEELSTRPDIMVKSHTPNLTVVTNAVNIATELATRPQVKLVVTGGVLHPRSYELVGSFAEEVIASVALSIAFVGANALDVRSGAATHDEREAVVNRLMAQRAERAVLVVDSSKLGRTAFASMGGPEVFDTVITDADADPEQLDALREGGYTVIVAGTGVRAA